MTTMSTPRPEIIRVSPQALKEAEALVSSGDVREAVASVLEAQANVENTVSSSLPPVLVDAGGLVHRCFSRLREDPWLALSLFESSSPGDKEVKAAFRQLALRLHPDKNRRRGWDTVPLFSTVYSAYEHLATASSRCAFAEQREKERLERAAAAASGGRKELDELEKRYAKARVKREQEALAKWRSEQKATAERWADDDHAAATKVQEKEHTERTRARLEKERKFRGAKLERERLEKAEGLRRRQSQKIQDKLAEEEREARSAVASLKAQAVALKKARDQARGLGSSGGRGFGARVSSAEGSSNTDAAAAAAAAASKKKKKKSQASKAEKGGASKQQPKKTDPLRAGGREDSSIASSASVVGSLPPNSEAFCVAFESGPMGFTLCDTSVHGVAMGWGGGDDDEGSGGSSSSSGGMAGGGSSQSPPSGNGGGDGSDGGGGCCEWSACVLDLDLSTKGPLASSAAGELGVLKGDLLVAINGLSDLRGLRFMDVCGLLGKTAFPRHLTFSRQLPPPPEAPLLPESEESPSGRETPEETQPSVPSPPQQPSLSAGSLENLSSGLKLGIADGSEGTGACPSDPHLAPVVSPRPTATGHANANTDCHSRHSSTEMQETVPPRAEYSPEAAELL